MLSLKYSLHYIHLAELSGVIFSARAHEVPANTPWPEAVFMQHQHATNIGTKVRSWAAI